MAKRKIPKQFAPMPAMAAMMPKPKVMPAAPPPMPTRPRGGLQANNNLALAMKGRK